MPRLFTGLEVPQDVAFALSLKKGGLPGARWIDKDNYHITLRYVGEVDNRTANEVADALDRFTGFERFALRLDHLGSFGGNKPRALYAGVEANDTLLRLQAAHERRPATDRPATRQPQILAAHHPGAPQIDDAGRAGALS